MYHTDEQNMLSTLFIHVCLHCMQATCSTYKNNKSCIATTVGIYNGTGATEYWLKKEEDELTILIFDRFRFATLK